MKVKIEIKSWWNGSLLFEYESEDNTLRTTLEKAVESSADLSGADLSGADLEGADLSGANLEGADLSGANLRIANLEGADLSGANLRIANLGGADLEGADLSGANLRIANLEGADLRSANLRSADLRSANLGGANLRSANLGGANLTPIKNDLFIVLLHSRPEIAFLKQALKDGKIDGSTYDGECACLSGTLEHGAIHNDGPQEVKRIECIKSVRDANRPIERFFLGIRQGDTPENNEPAKLVMEWIDEFEKLIA